MIVLGIGATLIAVATFAAFSLLQQSSGLRSPHAPSF